MKVGKLFLIERDDYIVHFQIVRAVDVEDARRRFADGSGKARIQELDRLNEYDLLWESKAVDLCDVRGEAEEIRSNMLREAWRAGYDYCARYSKPLVLGGASAAFGLGLMIGSYSPRIALTLALCSLVGSIGWGYRIVQEWRKPCDR